MNIYKYHYIALCSVLISPNLLAKEETKRSSIYNLTLKELLSVQVFSLATSTEKTLASTPSVASVITAADIKLLGAKTLSEVLNTIPGVHVSLSNELYSPKFIIRGITT
ncbi:MAG: TonB-dependent receptor plug domain-containing protein, partial [Psychrosphaera sp.]|nr:TonB-dependent receptor plug domain-containing protein [Psychrosphaera sp.]